MSNGKAPAGGPFRPRFKSARKTEPRRGSQTKSFEDGVRLFGIHAVEAALRNPERIVKRLALTENAERRLAEAIALRGGAIDRMTPRDLDRLLGPETVHQGALLETELLAEPSLDDIAERAMSEGPVLILDQVTDPHNVGAVLRSAAVFGSAGLIMHRRHSAPLNGTLAKSASGALELVPVHLAANLAGAMEQLKQRGVAVIGLDGGAGEYLEDSLPEGPYAFALGAEGKGLRQLTRETCDGLAKIGGTGHLTSLNVSNAAAVALHLAATRRRKVLKT